MCNIYTSVVSRHLVTRGINKILLKPPRHIIRSEEILPRFINHPSSNHTYTKSTPNHHYAPPPCNTHIHHLFNCTHVCTPFSTLDLWTDPARVTALLTRSTEKLAGGPQAGKSDIPTSKGHGNG